jgi:hypothetical protein
MNFVSGCQLKRMTLRIVGFAVLATISFAFFNTSSVDSNKILLSPNSDTAIATKKPIRKAQPLPTSVEVETTLEIELRRVAVQIDTQKLHSLAQTYALTYSLVHELHQRNVSVTLTFGSHLGALRHHGVIPFEEKDVDLAAFTTNASLIESAIKATLDVQPHLNITFHESDFGFQIVGGVLQTYIDIWMFDVSGTEITCVGHQQVNKSCRTWYKMFHATLPPVYSYDAWLPFRTALFGTERVPVPATNKPIESFHFDDKGPNFWNTTCGPDRRWNETLAKWLKVDMKERKCSDKYETYPFVFLKEGGFEQLRQGAIVIHEVAGVSHEEM